MSEIDNEEREHHHDHHRWSLLKDPEFYELGDLIGRVIATVQRRTDCTHTDSPLNDAIETLCYSVLSSREASIPPFLEAILFSAARTVGNWTFTAGVRFAHEGYALDRQERFLELPIIDQPPGHKYDAERAEKLHEWREILRDEVYRPTPKTDDEQSRIKAALGKILGKKFDDDEKIVVISDSQYRELLGGTEEEAPGLYL